MLVLLQDLCRLLTCPYGQKPYYGTCKSIALQSNGLGVEVSFNLTAVPDKSTLQLSNFSIEGLDAFAEFIYKRTRSSLGLKPSKCEYCQADIDVDDDYVVDVNVNILFYTTADCQLEHIIERSTRLLGRHIDIKVGRNDNIFLHVGLGNFYQTYPVPGRRHIRPISKSGVAKCAKTNLNIVLKSALKSGRTSCCKTQINEVYFCLTSTTMFQASAILQLCV